MARRTTSSRGFRQFSGITLWATCGGLGYLPAPGTVASIAALLTRLLIVRTVFVPFWYELIALTLFYLASFPISSMTVAVSGQKDPSFIVIDEYMAMWLVSFCIPQVLFYQLIGLVVFRFFDISKYGLLSYVEELPTIHAVMLDDLLAAVWAVGLSWLAFFLSH